MRNTPRDSAGRARSGKTKQQRALRLRHENRKKEDSLGYYLIDYENTKKAGMAGLESLTENDTVCLFYSVNADTLTFEMHEKINACAAKFELQQAIVGSKNALDFELVTYLGYLIGQNRREKYYIVSGDKGFESVCKYWAKRHVSVTLTANLHGRDERQETEKLVNEVAEATGRRDDAKKIADIIRKYKTKQGINNALMREFPSTENRTSSEIYRSIKALIKNKKGKE